MKICDRCFEEYNDEEFVKMDQFPDSYICIPCNYHFSDLYINFLREFLFNNQPERSKREDLIEKCNHKNDLHEYREKRGRCFDPLCYSCKDAVL